MDKFLKYFMMILMVSAITLAGCSDSDDDEPTPTPTETSFEVLTNYMISQNMDVSTVFDGWVVAPTAVHGKGIEDYYIIDIRGIDDYNAGHIEGAVHSSLQEVLDKAADAPEGKTILVACYTGQTAGHAVMALRLSGYPTAQVLKWGMCGWRDDLATKWQDNTQDGAGNYAIGNANWADAPGQITPHTETFSDPTIETQFTDGENILAERVDMMLEEFRTASKTSVVDNPSMYFINNYWDEENVEQYGNIIGAFRIKPVSLTDGSLNYLDPTKDIVTYCWTGQTSSMMTAYLYVIGYEGAKSLTFGANGMIYDNLDDNDKAHKWFLQGNNYDVVPTK
jgi:rhodanese-related sulfurtransferase